MRNIFVRFSLIIWTFLLAVMPALAQDAPAGQVVTKQDWLDFMPIVIGSIIIVLVVDAFFIMPIFRKNNQDDGNKSA